MLSRGAGWIPGPKAKRGGFRETVSADMLNHFAVDLTSFFVRLGPLRLHGRLNENSFTSTL